jgi:hypothetical protein
MKDKTGNYKNYEDLPKFQKYLCSQDIGEPSCWACGMWDEECDIVLDDNIDPFTAWDKAKYLERCHIVPRSMGGPDKASNLVLLCKKCHKSSPDLLKKKYMKKWIIKPQSHVKQSMVRLNSCKKKHLRFASENMEDYFEFYHSNSSFHVGADTAANHIPLIKEFYKANKNKENK